MAEEKKFLDQAGLKQAFELIKANVAANYVAKVAGKGLSTNDFTDALKFKLENLDVTGEENVIEVVKINGTAAVPTDKEINITSADLVTSAAIAEALGFVPASASDVAAINTLKYQVVTELPAIADADKETIYLIKAAREDVASNVYVEYFVVNGAWEEIGDTQLALDDYAKTEDVEAAIADANAEVLTEVETNYVKEVEFVEKVTEAVNTEEVIKVIEENIHTMTEAEIIALFEQAPVVMHEDGTYDVVENGEAAIAAAQAGDTVVLVEDVEIVAGTEIADGVVLDLNGHTLTVKA